MIWQIAKAGLFDNLYSRRVQFVTVATVLLVALSTLLHVNLYRRAVQDYNAKLHTQDVFVSEQGELSRLYDMTPPEVAPPPLSVFVKGVPLKASQSNISQNLLSPSSFNQNPFPELFYPLDLSAIILAVLSLTAILVAHNAITKEKESGTLRLVLSNPVPRWKFVVGKWLAGIMTVVPPYLLGILLALVIAFSTVLNTLKSGDLGAFLMILASSLVYIGAFYAIGLAISSLCHSSGTAILISFVFWVLVVLVLPNLGPYVAAQLRPLPSVNKIEKDIAQFMGQERDDTLVRKYKEAQAQNDARFQPVLAQYGYTAAQFRSMPEADRDKLIKQIGASNAEFQRLWDSEQEQMFDIVRQVDRDFRSRADKMEDDLQSQVDRQTRLGVLLTTVLPSSAFVYAATQLAGTNSEDVKRVDLQRRQYKDQVISYILDKVRTVGGANPAEEHIPLNDRPRFGFQARDLQARLAAAAPHLGVLVLWNLLAFAVAFFNLQRYDVR